MTKDPSETPNPCWKCAEPKPSHHIWPRGGNFLHTYKMKLRITLKRKRVIKKAVLISSPTRKWKNTERKNGENQFRLKNICSKHDTNLHLRNDIEFVSIYVGKSTHELLLRLLPLWFLLLPKEMLHLGVSLKDQNISHPSLAIVNERQNYVMRIRIIRYALFVHVYTNACTHMHVHLCPFIEEGGTCMCVWTRTHVYR